MQTRKLKITESPIVLEKLLTEKVEAREPKVLASPNAFDWEKRLVMAGGSPNAFALSLNSGNEQLFDYPSIPQDHPPINGNTAHQEINDLLSLNATSAEAGSNFHFLADRDEIYSESSSTSMSGKTVNPLPPKQITHNRRDSHRESERRRRESFKTAMFHLENLVVLTLNRAGSCKILGKGPNRKLAHAEVYRMARDIIVTLKEEIVKIEQMNNEMASKLKLSQ